MRSYTKAQVQESLQSLNLREKDTILIHSALQNLGRLEGEEFARIPHFWRNFLLGQRHTLILPTFNYDFPKSRSEDLRIQKSQIGILNEEFRQIAKLRSNHPMFSFVGFGEDAEEILSTKEAEWNPFLTNSVYHRLFLRDALMLFVGIDIRVCTFMVYIEAMCAVKYRFFKPFLGEIISLEGNKIQGEFYHFCLPRNEQSKVNYSKIQQELLGANILRFFPLGGSGIYAFRAKEFFDFVQNRLRQEPFILLETAPRAYYQFVNNAEVKIESINGGGGQKCRLLLQH